MTISWPGSRWWKIDFHTHTPKSIDYKGDSAISPEDWLVGFKDAGVNCVVVADHNTGEWIDSLKAALKTLKQYDHDRWWDFEIFPAVEISCNGGVHMIAIFDPSKSGSDVSALMGAVGYNGTFGDSDAVTQKSVNQVIDDIHGFDGIACAAHIDKPKGLFRSITDHNTIMQIISKMDAVEIINPDDEVIAEHSEKLTGFASVLGSDSHKPEDAARGYTWVKMSAMTIEGLRLALLDPQSSIVRSDVQELVPQSPPEFWIESIKMEKLHLSRVNPLAINLNPFYNAFIGGRGSGKSTIVECLRLAMGRAEELKTLKGSPEIIQTFKNFKEIYTPASKIGMFLNDSEISVIVNKGQDELLEKYKYVWKSQGEIGENKLSIYRLDDESWKDIGLNQEQAMENFPVKIFSQKQILALANNPQSLLEYIDNSIAIEIATWNEEFEKAKSDLLNARKKVIEQRLALVKKPALENEFAEARRKARVFSNSTFGDLLKAYRRANSQQNKVDKFLDELEKRTEILSEAISAIATFPPCELSDFLEETDNEKEINQQLLVFFTAFSKQFDSLAVEINNMVSSLNDEREHVRLSNWQKENDAHIEAYKLETERLKAEGIESPQAASDAVAKEAQLSEQISKLRELQEKLPVSENAVAEAEEALMHCREKLTDLRKKFIEQLFEHDDMLKVTLRSTGDVRGAVEELRGILRISGTSQFTDIFHEDLENSGNPSGILWDMIDPTVSTSTGERLVEIKRSLEEKNKNILNTEIHGRLVNRLKELPVEVFDELSYWFPEDEVILEYRPGLGQSYKSISQASAGQKTAAILSFLLVHGDEPLIVDQPEDDLDNALVSDLVVKQLRENKKHRQLIIVSHNANVVVNADAELVTTMDFISGQIVSNHSGGLQERATREDICRIMEGGHEAFRQRYKRILKDLESVA